ncbi:MAG: sigma-70 family RNA polymerase sigma factor, partial [Candidatus Methanomethylicaceae archaeon]
LEEAALGSQVRAALARLSEEERQLVEWYFGEGLSEREIAKRLECSHVTVHRRLRRAWAHLCGALGVELPFPARESKKFPKKLGKSDKKEKNEVNKTAGFDYMD